MRMNIETERIYDAPQKKGGYRVLVDRLWPRGLRKENVHVDLWLKAIAPSTELRKWFAHDPAKWQSFKQRYFAEIKNNQEAVNQLTSRVKDQTLVLLYGAKDTEHNQAIALKEYLEHKTPNPSKMER